MAKFSPQYFGEGSEAQLRDGPGNTWLPVLSHDCSFNPDQFFQVMSNLVRNPNLNSTWLFRADILFGEGTDEDVPASEGCAPLDLAFDGFVARQKLVRRLIPRNPQRDQPLDQTCLFLQSEGEQGRTLSAVVYLPHLSSRDEVPFYHPAVRGIAHLHEWDASLSKGTISLHYWHFDDDDQQAATKLQRTALHLLSHLYKIGQGAVAGYVKRVNHDTLVPQKRLQDTQTALKAQYAKPLIDSWAEQTDPLKHVFEDICIAAFLIELWKDMYRDVPFPGFVDIGCGNGLLVYILRQQGYSGWGFDARARKSWALYNSPVPGPEKSPAEGEDSLRAAVLLPSLISCETPPEDQGMIHDGVFPKGTFIISNHADELTPWTPILAAHSECPFIMIPCCSHNLAGAKFRAPRPLDTSKGTSTFASLVAWVTGLAVECGFEAETEMLRIPSTRNTAIVGRKWTGPVDLGAIIAKHGGADGYYNNVSSLLHSAPRAH